MLKYGTELNSINLTFFSGVIIKSKPIILKKISFDSISFDSLLKIYS